MTQPRSRVDLWQIIDYECDSIRVHDSMVREPYAARQHERILGDRGPARQRIDPSYRTIGVVAARGISLR